MGKRIIYVSPEFLIAVLKNERFECVTPFPKDARAVRINSDELNMRFGLQIESAEYDGPEEGQVIPELPPLMFTSQHVLRSTLANPFKVAVEMNVSGAMAYEMQNDEKLRAQMRERIFITAMSTAYRDKPGVRVCARVDFEPMLLKQVPLFLEGVAIEGESEPCQIRHIEVVADVPDTFSFKDDMGIEHRFAASDKLKLYTHVTFDVLTPDEAPTPGQKLSFDDALDLTLREDKALLSRLT